MGENEKDKTKGANEKIMQDAENFARLSRNTARTVETTRTDRELAASALLTAKDKLKEELKEVKKERKEKE